MCVESRRVARSRFALGRVAGSRRWVASLGCVASSSSLTCHHPLFSPAVSPHLGHHPARSPPPRCKCGRRSTMARPSMPMETLGCPPRVPRVMLCCRLRPLGRPTISSVLLGRGPTMGRHPPMPTVTLALHRRGQWRGANGGEGGDIGGSII